MNRIPFQNSFASHNRAQYWSYKNNIQPTEVYKNSKSKYWFKCDNCNHHFEKSTDNISRGQWCPYCCTPTKSLCDDTNCDVCYKKSLASFQGTCCGAQDVDECVKNGCNCKIKKLECWDKENLIEPRQIIKNSITKYIINCKKCNHKFSINAHSINSGKWCSYCANKKICKNDECVICYNKSFASNVKSLYWSEKNRDQPEGYHGLYKSPRHVFLNDNDKYIFDCLCGHINIQSPSSINSGSWCKYCCISNKILCTDDACITCYNNSYAGHTELCCGAVTIDDCIKITCGCGYKKVDCWDKTNTLNPRNVVKGSNNIIIFKCNICPHTFSTRLAHKSWCPYCAKRCLCNNIDCIWCYNNSFKSQPQSQYWSQENSITPREVFKSTPKKYKFKCENGHNFIQMISSIFNGSWCPYCVNKTEKKVYDTMRIMYPDIKTQYRVDWCKYTTYLPFDFVIIKHNF